MVGERIEGELEIGVAASAAALAGMMVGWPAGPVRPSVFVVLSWNAGKRIIGLTRLAPEPPPLRNCDVPKYDQPVKTFAISVTVGWV
jgi:hypothetical protein